MRKINPYSFLVLLMFLWACTAHKVNIEKMSEKQRTAYLTNTAKEVLKKYPEFYRENAPVTIEKRKTVSLKPEAYIKNYENPNSPWHGMHPNQTYYAVIFHQDENKDNFTQGYLARIYIREDTGRAIQIMLGSNIAYTIKE